MSTGDYQTTYRSFCFISDELDHGVPMVKAIQCQVVDALKGIVEGFNAVEYFTDGCAEQYKNFKSFSNIVYHHKDFSIAGTWSFLPPPMENHPAMESGGMLNDAQQLKV